MKYLQRLFSILLITGMVIGFIQPFVAKANSLETSSVQANTKKIEAGLLNQLDTGPADFIVVMQEQADVSAAYQLQTKAEKGQFVFDQLVETATRTQANLRTYLEIERVDHQSFYIMNAILVKQGNLKLAQEIEKLPEVAEIIANHEFQLDQPMINPNTPNVPTAIEPNITFVKADQVWTMGFTGQGTVMAGNDTGLSWNHPALIRQYRGCLNPPSCTTIDHNFNWWDATGTYPSVPTDGHGHGTHTTGTMVGDDGGANQIGMAPGARTVHCKNMTDSGNGSDATFLTCFQWDLAPWDLSGSNPTPSLAPDAINNSWGYSGGNNNVFRNAILNLHAAGIVVEVSAGNEGSACASLRSPGDYQEVFTTGSINHASAWPGTMTGFSSRGPSDLDGNYFPDFTAPGENIRSSVPGGSYQGGWSGTSMAGPHVTALIGLMWSANPSLKGQIQITYDIIQQTAAPVTSYVGSCGGDYVTGPNNDWGYGTIDALAAVNMAISYGGAGILQGTVTDAATTLPISGVTIQAIRQEGGAWTGTTDGTGFYQLTVAAGTFDITASHDRYTSNTANNIIVIEDGTTIQDFALQPRGHLYGYVTDQDSGVPLAATVSVAGGPSTSTNPSTGFYEFYLDPGTYDVTASAPDYADETFSVTLAIGSQVQQDFTLLAAIAVVPDPIAITIEMGQTGSVSSLMTNNMAVDYPFMFIELPSGLRTEGSGGPDPFGYTYADSNEPGGARFEWIDATDGTALNLTDDGEANVTLPFTFNFYGVDSTAIRVGNNGGLLFNVTTGDLSVTNADLGTTATNNLIVPFWDDIDSDTGNVFWKVVGSAPTRMLVVEWFDRPHYSNTPGHTTFELILFEGTNNIKYQYLDVDFDNPTYNWGASATVGIRGFLPNYLQYSYNQPVVENGMAICFSYPGSPPCDGGDITWFSTSIMSGTVPAGGTINWTNILSATTEAGISQPGVYTGNLRVVPTVQGLPSKMVGIEMTVLPSGVIGQLEGTVTSDRPGSPLEATVLIESTGGFTITLPTDPLTGYYNYWLEAGLYDVTASADGYLPQTTSVTIVGQSVTIQDFELEFIGPEIVVDPTSLVQALTMGETATQTMSISNPGNLPLTFEIAERNGDFFPASLVEDILVVRHDTAAADAMQDALTSLGYTFLGVTDTQFQAMTVDQLLQYMAVFHAGTTGTGSTPGPSELLLTAYLDAGGSLYISDNDLGYYRDPGVFYNTYLQAIYNVDNGGSIIDGLDIMAGLTVDITPDPYPDGISVGAEGAAIFQFQGSSDYAGTAVGRMDYRAVYTAFDFDDVVDPAHEVEIISRVLDYIAVSDIPWLFLEPITGTVGAGETSPVNVTFDAGIAVEPGTYTADLRISHNDPLAMFINVPVTLTVTPSADYGRLEGVVNGQGYCDADPGPLEAEVLIEASDGSNWIVPTNPGDGSYFRWLLGGTYTVTASAENHLPWTAVVQVTAQQTTIQDFGLRLNESCLSWTPPNFTLTMPVNTLQTESLTINNDGAGELLWEVHETTRTVGLEGISIPRFTGTLPEDKNPVSIERDPNAPTNTGSGFLPLMNPGLPAYGINLSTDVLYYWPDIDFPGTWNQIGSPGIGEAYAADFAGSDFNTLYVLDDATYNVFAVDTSTGTSTIIGSSGLSGPQIMTGMAWDPTTSTMYASSTDGTTAKLYTLNLSTGLATFVTNITGAPYNIDIAIDGNGQMYGHEIAMDVLISIDKTTGATTVIGPTGFTANYAQGMDYDLDNDILYLAAYNYTSVGVGEIRIADTTTGATVLVGTIPGGAETDSFAILGAGEPPWNDVPWVTEVPTNGVLGPDSTFDVDVTFDTTGLTAGECYTASLGLVHDDPGVVTPSYIPLELCVVEWVYGVDLEPESSSAIGAPGETITYTLRLTNTGNVIDTYTVSTSNVEPGWSVSLPVTSFELAAGTGVDVLVVVNIPGSALDEDFDTFTVAAISTNDPTITDEVEITTTVNIDIFKFFLPLVNKN